MELQKIRNEINKIDDKIAYLLEQRAKKVKELNKIKKRKKLKIIDKKREQEILMKMETEYKRSIFKKIISESRKLQDE